MNLIQLMEVTGQEARGGAADLGDGEGRQESIQGCLPRLVELALQVVHGLLPPPIESHKLRVRHLPQGEEAGRRHQQLGVEELHDHLLAQGVDLESAPARHVHGPPDHLGATSVDVGAAHVLALADDLGAAGGAHLGHGERLAVLHDDAGPTGALRVQQALGDGLVPASRSLVRARLRDTGDLRDHVARALHQHPVAGPRAQGQDVVLVVQGRVPDGDPEHLDGVHVGPRGEATVDPHLDLDRPQDRGGLHRRELVGVLPLGGAGRAPQAIPELHVVQLGHDPVHLKGDLVAPLLHGGVVLQASLDPLHRGVLARRREAPLGQQSQPRRVGGGQVHAFAAHDGVGVELQRISTHLRGVAAAQGTGRCVARVGQGGLPALLPIQVEPVEPIARDEDLPAHLEQRRGRVEAKAHGHIPHGPQVGGDVLARGAVPPGQALDEDPVPVDERRGDPVELRLHVPRELLPFLEAEEPMHLGGEVPRLLGAPQALYGEHRDRVTDLVEAVPLGQRRADPLGGALGRDERGMLRLELLELTEERVVLGIRDLDAALVVVELVVPEDLPAQPVEALCRPRTLGRRGRHRALSIERAGVGRRRSAPAPRRVCRPACRSCPRLSRPVLLEAPARSSCCRRHSMDESVPHGGGGVHAGARDQDQDPRSPSEQAVPGPGPRGRLHPGRHRPLA